MNINIDNSKSVSRANSRMKMLLENYLNAKKDGLKEGFDLKPVETDNYEHFYILFKPQAGIYRDQFHILEMKTKYGHGSEEITYPINTPYIKFNTNVLHTNISTGGAICLDILKDKSKWLPTYDFSSIIRNILMLFEQPNNLSPFNSDACKAYVECEKVFVSRKKKNMSLQEEEQLKEKCFEEFKKTADHYASKNTKEFETNYVKWFPQLLDNTVQYKSDELEEITSMLEVLNAKKKKKDTTKDVTDTTKDVVDVNTKDTTNDTTSVNTTKDINTDTVKKTFNTSKFDKYRKK